MAGQAERVVVLLVTLVTVAVNALAGTRGINGLRTGEVAARYDLPFIPAGWVFSIWGAIYLALAAFSLYQFAGPGAASGRAAAVRPAYVFSGVANVTWLWFWHHEALPATLVVMLLLLASLTAVVRYLAIDGPGSPAESWCLDATFSLYLGWVSVATLANLSVVVAARLGALLDVNAFSQLMLAAVLALVVFAYLRLRDPVFLAVLAWAASGIALKTAQPAAVAILAMVVAGAAGIAAIVLLVAPMAAGGATRQSRTA